jgi:signal transduction histidine kinase
MLLLIPSVFLLLANWLERKPDINATPLRALHILINIFVLALCALISVDNEITGGQPFPYVTAIFSIASMIMLVPGDRIIVFGPSFCVYIVGMLIVQQNRVHLIQDMIFSTLLMGLAFEVSHINYSLYYKNFKNNRIISEKNRELDNMYKSTEEALKKRTEELEKAKELEKLRTAFFANISHELRTPLNVIYAAQQMLDKMIKNRQIIDKQNDAKEYMKIIKQNCFRLIRLIANLIDITKIDAGYLQVNLKSCDIVKTVEDITLSVAKYVEDRKLSLVFDTEMEEKVTLYDPDKIERIMLNLLSNAVKFTSEGGSIYVNMYERDEKVIISVKDTGIGIPENMREAIFYRFVQVDNTMSRSREGSGIGLSIVKSMVEMHGGTIKVLSRQGVGSEFIIELPIKEGETCRQEELSFAIEKPNIEKVNIEFSDIYY